MIRPTLILTAVLTLGLSNTTPAEVQAPTPQVVSVTDLHSRPDVTDEDMTIWHRVAWCETHAQWHRAQPNFDGGLGIARVNWVAFGGTQYAPAPHLASPREQVEVAKRINHGYAVPDAFGCSAW